jgi:hypothetical protein
MRLPRLDHFPGGSFQPNEPLFHVTVLISDTPCDERLRRRLHAGMEYLALWMPME